MRKHKLIKKNVHIRWAEGKGDNHYFTVISFENGMIELKHGNFESFWVPVSAIEEMEVKD